MAVRRLKRCTSWFERRETIRSLSAVGAGDLKNLALSTGDRVDEPLVIQLFRQEHRRVAMFNGITAESIGEASGSDLDLMSLKVTGDHLFDRPGVEAWQHVKPTGTSDSAA